MRAILRLSLLGAKIRFELEIPNARDTRDITLKPICSAEHELTIHNHGLDNEGTHLTDFSVKPIVTNEKIQAFATAMHVNIVIEGENQTETVYLGIDSQTGKPFYRSSNPDRLEIAVINRLPEN